MPKATWKGALLAQADAAQVQWKGTCSYYDVRVGDEVNKDAAWYYPQCKPEAKHIEGFIAFWKGVKVE